MSNEEDDDMSQNNQSSHSQKQSIYLGYPVQNRKYSCQNPRDKCYGHAWKPQTNNNIGKK